MEKRKKERFAPNEQTSESEKEEEKHIPPASFNLEEEWVREYIRQFGEEPSFF